MKTNYLSAPVTALNPSLVTIAAWDSRSPAISRKEKKRTKVRGVGFTFLLAAFLGSCVTTELRAQVATEDSVDTAPATTAIPWSQLGAKAGANYQGDALAVIPTAEGARLRCVFQRLEGEATREGLWLTSTVSNAVNDRFRLVAVEVGRGAPCVPKETTKTSNIQHPTTNIQLENTGTVSIDGQSVRFTRPGLVEEYTASMDGMRQDFVVLERPPGLGELVLRLAVSGASVESAAFGAQVVLANSGRKIAYNRLKVTDANGRELPARMEVISSDQVGRVTPCAPRPAAIGNDSETRDGAHGVPRPTMLVVLVKDAEAVYPVRIDPTFSDANWSSMGGIPGADNPVSAVVVDGSGNLYIGGEFNLVGDVMANHVAKWDGSSWSALGSGMSGGDSPRVSALAVAGSDLYAGGSFTTAGGLAATNIAKWNGSSWSALGSGLSGVGEYPYVRALAVSGTNLYAGGLFTTAGGSVATNIAKWNGSSWSALGSGLGGDDASVWALAVSGSDLYAGGSFTTAGGSVATNIAKWNGSSWSAMGSGLNGNVWALAVSGSDLYAGGWFTTAGGLTANSVAKWNGSTWSALGSGLGDRFVAVLAVSGTNLYAGGFFTTAGGSPANNLAKWNGSTWSALSSGTSSGFYPTVWALAVSGTNLYAGGYFLMAGGLTANYIAKWNGSNWSALGSGSGMNIDGYVSALAMSGSDLYVGGYFTTAGDSAATNIAKWDGSSWSALGSGMNGGVVALAVSGSNLYAGGSFTTAGGSAANYIAKWDGSSWSALGSGMSGGEYGPWVFALAVAGNDLYVGGSFTTAGGSAATNIAKWDGSSWSALGSGMGGGSPIIGPHVKALAVSGSNLYAGGEFKTAGGSTANRIAKWNGSSWSALGSGLSGGDYPSVSALAVSGSNLYAGGEFTTAGGSAANNIAKWDGSSWSALGSGMNGGVVALAVSGSNLYAGGSFTTAGGSAANYIAKWDGSSWSPLGSGMNDYVYALAVSGSDLYAGGLFTTAGGKVSAYIARAYLPALPTLSVLRSGEIVTVSWPTVDTAGFALEQAGPLAAPAGWVTNSATVTNDGTNKSVTLPATNSSQFFRLRRP